MSDKSRKNLKPGWRWMKFGDVVRQCKEKADPETSGLERYVAGDHMSTDDLRIRRWGEIGSGYLGPAFHMRFKPGQVLYGSRRTYLRKVALADFEGICANTTFVLASRNSDDLLPSFLPFLMQADSFNEFSVRKSKGSVNPYINFSDLAEFEFALPPLEEQRRILDFLLAIEESLESLGNAMEAGKKLFESALFEAFENLSSAKIKKVKECYDIQLGKMSSQKARLGQNQKVYIKNNNVLWGGFDFSELPQMSFDEREVEKYSLRYGDLLVCEGGEIGRAAIWKGAVPGMLYQKALHRLRPKTEDDVPDFMFHYLRYCAKKGILEGVATGTTIRHLPVEQLSELQLPFPFRQDQQRIAQAMTAITDGIARIGERLEVVKKVKAKALSEAIAGEV